MAFPNVLANVNCRFRVDFLTGSVGCGVVFEFCRFGEGAMSSEDEVDLLSS